MKKMEGFEKWDSAEVLKSDEEMQHYLDEHLKHGDPALIAHAVGVIARAKGMTKVAREAGLSREALYRALSLNGNPELATVMKVARACGIEFHATIHTASTTHTPARRKVRPERAITVVG